MIHSERYLIYRSQAQSESSGVRHQDVTCSYNPVAD